MPVSFCTMTHMFNHKSRIDVFTQYLQGNHLLTRQRAAATHLDGWEMPHIFLC